MKKIVQQKFKTFGNNESLNIGGIRIRKKIGLSLFIKCRFEGSQYVCFKTNTKQIIKLYF